MNPSYARVKSPLDSAMRRMLAWLASQELVAPRVVKVADAVRLACDERGQWRGAAMLVFEHDGWSVFEDLSGGLGGISAARWRQLAGTDSLVVAGYNDSVPYGEFIVVECGSLVRAFLDDQTAPTSNVNIGDHPPLRSWVDVASIVDEDPFLCTDKDEGLLWLLGAAPESR